MHMAGGDPRAREDIVATRESAAAAPGELLLDPGTGHVVAHPGSSDFDAAIADQILQRAVEFLSAFK